MATPSRLLDTVLRLQQRDTDTIHSASASAAQSRAAMSLSSTSPALASASASPATPSMVTTLGAQADTKPWLVAYLAALSLGWSRAGAAEQAGTTYQQVYAAVRSDEQLAAAEAEAIEAGSDWYEDQLRRLATGGRGNVAAAIVALKVRGRYVETPYRGKIGQPGARRSTPVDSIPVDQLAAWLDQQPTGAAPSARSTGRP